MRKIVASVGLVALGASGLQAASLEGGGEPAKPWNASLTLRGFYDDNINTTTPKQSAWGWEASPSVQLKWSLEQTEINLGYVYSAKYYDHTPFGNTDRFDQDHTFNAYLSHAFTERYRATVTDSFVVGQEPDQLRTGYAFATFQRVPGSNYRNYGTINFDAQLTPLLGTQVGYGNTFYDYADKGAKPGLLPVTGVVEIDGVPTLVSRPQIFPSNAGLLNRLEHTIHLDSRWTLQPQTIGIIGYQFQEVDYTADEVISGLVNDPVVFGTSGPVLDPVFSKDRNTRSHYGYVGVDQTFRPDLTANVRVGAQYTDYYNDPNVSSGISPYAQLSLRYTYATESYVEAGFNYQRGSTDQIGFNSTAATGASRFTVDVQNAVVYGSLTQRIMPKLYGSLLAQFQDSSFQGGVIDNESERLYMVGLNMEYRFTRNLSANAGYNYDKLDADTGVRTGYDRNQVYLGVTASY